MAYPEPIPPEQWGRDHWTTIAYAFTQAARPLERSRLRSVDSGYPTRLQGGEPLEGHDDYDCLADAQAAGVLIHRGSGLHPFVTFTPQGLVFGQWLVVALETHQVRSSTLTALQALRESGAELPSFDPDRQRYDAELVDWLLEQHRAGTWRTCFGARELAVDRETFLRLATHHMTKIGTPVAWLVDHEHLRTFWLYDEEEGYEVVVRLRDPRTSLQPIHHVVQAGSSVATCGTIVRAEWTEATPDPPRLPCTTQVRCATCPDCRSAESTP